MHLWEYSDALLCRDALRAAWGDAAFNLSDLGILVCMQDVGKFGTLVGKSRSCVIGAL